jgi:hypothetical protein
MGFPQVVIIVIYVLSLGISLANHGKPREGKVNFWVALVTVVFIFLILNGGGFFK